MDNRANNWNAFFIGFGVITILSGLYLIYDKDYLIGCSGTVVGIWLFSMNFKNRAK